MIYQLIIYDFVIGDIFNIFSNIFRGIFKLKEFSEVI